MYSCVSFLGLRLSPIRSNLGNSPQPDLYYTHSPEKGSDLV